MRWKKKKKNSLHLEKEEEEGRGWRGRERAKEKKAGTPAPGAVRWLGFLRRDWLLEGRNYSANMTIISCLATAHQSRETTQVGNPRVCIPGLGVGGRSLSANLLACNTSIKECSPLLSFLFLFFSTVSSFFETPFASASAHRHRHAHAHTYRSICLAIDSGEGDM